jgi:GntR family transcriptional regulator, transcriptional repressor for pyruvate dehydrogenase complex
MTEQPTTVATPPPDDPPAAAGAAPTLLLPPRAAPQSLVADLARQLAEQIRSERFKAGDRLPTEAELMRQGGVSRTVVREAVAALRAEGLVVTRQGVGAFVAETPTPALAGFTIDAETVATLRQVLKVMELRIGIEVEAAGLAAARRNATQLEAIVNAQKAFRAEIAGGASAPAADFALHRAIFAATGNEYFGSFLDFLGQIIIPRQLVRFAQGPSDQQSEYLQRVAREHDRVVEAIADGDAEAAREAMRTHLERGRSRYARMAAELAADEAEPST